MAIMPPIPASSPASPGDDGPPDALFGAALAAVAGLPPAGIDALWAAGVVADSPVPQAPSPSASQRVLANADPAMLEALAAATRDSQVLHAVVVKATPSAEPVARAAAANPVLSDATFTLLDTDAASHTLVAARRSARASLAACGANASLAPATADELFAAGEALYVADIVAAGRADGTLGAALWHKLIGATWGAKASQSRLVRDTVLVIADPPLRAELAAAVATNRNAPLTPVAAAAAVELIDAGTLAIGDVTARMDGDAFAWSRTAGATAVALGDAQFTDPAADEAAKRRAAMAEAGVYDTAADEAAMLLALGMADAAHHTILSSDSPVDQAVLDAALDDAAVETLADWAERRLGRVPAPGDLLRHLSRLPLGRLRELADELAVRPDPLVCNPELVFTIPSVTEAKVSPTAARWAAALLTDQLGGDDAAWAVLAQMVADGDDATLLELATASAAVTAPSGAPVS
jgi:hypothetical protein